jgi:hypothetical protein
VDLLEVSVKGAAGAYAATSPTSFALRFPANESCARAGVGSTEWTCTAKSKGKTLVCK